MKKRGIMKIIEMVFAILIISAVVLTLAVNRKTQSERDLSEILPSLLEEIARNAKLREEIILGSQASNSAEEIIMEFLSERIKNPSLDYTIKICEVDEICALDEYPISKEIFASERIISKTLKSPEGTTPKKIRLFLWIK